MFEHKKLENLNDYFTELNKRDGSTVFFYRINGYSDNISSFIERYYDEAVKYGVVIEGKIPNPDEKNLSYYEEMMGLSFQMSTAFIDQSLRRWLPRMNEYQRQNIAVSLYATLDSMHKSGKNENMLKNAYIKFMCWLYYKFERIVNQLGEGKIPKILYEGNISNYELKIITVLSNAGCDVVLLQHDGEKNYLTLDPASELSDEYKESNMTAFPDGFSIKGVRENIRKREDIKRLYGQTPSVANCTNAWIEGKALEDIEKDILIRGNDERFYYNCFYRINGVEDKLTYTNELFQFQQHLVNSHRKVVIVEKTISQPGMDEINSIKRSNYASVEQMITGLSKNIQYTANIELQRLMNKAFIDIISEESQLPGMNLNKLTNKAVYILCWLKRYQSQLFGNWKMPEIGCFIYLGGCKNENESMFVRLLSRLPVDVLILNPNLNEKCCLTDSLLYEITYNESLLVEIYPREVSDVQIGTAAYHAERELDTLMYQDSGIYRNQQYSKAVTVTLKTMYEEIEILWPQELKYRPNFSIIDDVVNIPAIFAKVSGVKDADVSKYWSSIKTLMIEDTFVIKNVPYINPTDANPIKAFSTEFYKNGRLQREKIKNHSGYRYGVLREEIQDHILDKLQLLIDQKIIKGTFENGTEYTIVATALNLNKDIIRMLQKFDFTKKNPKLIYINTTEKMISLEDSILTAFLNLLGFDIVFFVPTGYQNIERYFNRQIMEEHQLGEYMYDLRIPEFGAISSGSRHSWRERIFKRGS